MDGRAFEDLWAGGDGVKPGARIPEVLTLEEAAKLLRLCPHTVSKQARKGVLPGKKCGREWRFNRSELMRCLNGDRAA